MNRRLVMEEDEDVVKAGAEFQGEDIKDQVMGSGHGDDVLFYHDETFSCEPNDVVV